MPNNLTNNPLIGHQTCLITGTSEIYGYPAWRKGDEINHEIY